MCVVQLCKLGRLGDIESPSLPLRVTAIAARLPARYRLSRDCRTAARQRPSAPISAHHLPTSGCNSPCRISTPQLAQRRYCAQFFSAKPRETKRLRCQVPTGREDLGGGAAQLNKARVPQRRCAFALLADTVLALVLNLNLGLLAKLCVCIPFLPGKRPAILVHDIPAERDDDCLHPRRPALRIGWWSDLTRPHFFFLRLCFYACSSCPRALTGETLRRLLWEKRAGRTASGNAGCAIGTARNDSCGVLLSIPPVR